MGELRMMLSTVMYLVWELCDTSVPRGLFRTVVFVSLGFGKKRDC